MHRRRWNLNVKNESLSTTFAKRIFGFSMASWINCAISLISTPITTALFFPKELGKINLFISFANILIPFIYLGFDQAYVRFFNEPTGKNTPESTFKLCLIISSLMSCLTSLVVFCGWKYFSRSIIGYESLSIALCLAVYLFATMILRYVNLKARMENNVKLFCTQSVTSTIIIKLSFASVAIIKANAQYAIIARTVLLLLAAIILSYSALLKCKKERIDYSKSAITELGKFALPIFPTTFLIMLNVSLAQLMLNKYADYTMIGIYSNAVTIASIITIVQSGLNTFWTPFVYEYYKEQSRIQKMHHVITCVMLCMPLGLIAVKDLVYLVLVDQKYWASKSIMAILLISPISDTVSETLGLGIELSKKTYLKLPVYIINIAVNFTACYFLIPRFGIYGAALANALASLSMLISKTIIGERYYKCSDTYYRLVLGMVIVATIAIINYYINNSILITILAVFGILIICLLYKTTLKALIEIAKPIVRKSIRR